MRFAVVLVGVLALSCVVFAQELLAPNVEARWDDDDDWLCADDELDEAYRFHFCRAEEADAMLERKDSCDITNQQYTCNCGCGVYDPDCDLPLRYRPQDYSEDATYAITCSPSGVVLDGRYTLCQRRNSHCYTVPLGWTCEAKYWNQELTTWYDDGENRTTDCHCGCGIWDPDCDKQETDPENVNVRCGVADGVVENWNVAHDHQVCARNFQCLTVPAEWTCPASWYNEMESELRSREIPYCDCSCGAPDPDCTYEHYRQITDGDEFGLTCGGNPSSPSMANYCNLNTLMCDVIPNGWTCPSRYYNEVTSGSLGPNGMPDCNCDCDVLDPDCDLVVMDRRIGRSGLLCKGGMRADETNPSSTDKQLRNYCDREDLECTSAPREWAPRCVSDFYDEIGQGIDAADSRCDCACGHWDPDCDSTESTLYCIPDQYVPTYGRYECSPSTLQCRTSPRTTTTGVRVSDFDEMTYGTSPGRSKPRCDCGKFEEYDPDCNWQTTSDVDTTCGSDEFCNEEFNVCQAVPSGWECSPALYSQIASGTFGNLGAPQCDCGCGIWDPDCDAQVHRYSYSSQELLLNCEANSPFSPDDRSTFCGFDSNTCLQAPNAWTGAPMWFNESSHGTITIGDQVSCHCGLGIWDPDCNLRDLNITRCGRYETLYSRACVKSCPTCTPETTRSRTSSAQHVAPTFMVGMFVVVFGFLFSLLH